MRARSGVRLASVLAWSLGVATLAPAPLRAEDPPISVRGIRADDGNAVEVTSAGLAALEPGSGGLAFTLYVSTAPDAPFEVVRGAKDVRFAHDAPVDLESTTGHRRTAKDKVVLVDESVASWRHGEPWPKPRRYRVGQKRVKDGVPSPDETLSPETEPRVAIWTGVGPEPGRFEVDEIPRNGWIELPLEFGFEDQHLDCAGAHLVLKVGPWTGHAWTPRLEGPRGYTSESLWPTPDNCRVTVRIPASLAETTLEVEGEWEGRKARASIPVVPSAPAVAAGRERAATFARSRESRLEAMRAEAAQLGPRLAEIRAQLTEVAKDPAMAEEVERRRFDLDTGQLEFALLQLAIGEGDPASEADAAEAACEWGRAFAAADKARALEAQSGPMRVDRWSKVDADRGRRAREQSEDYLLDAERRRAEAAERAGIASAFKESMDAQLAILAGRRDLEKQGKALETLAHGLAALAGDRDRAADALRRAREALVAAAPDADREALRRSYEENPLPSWWPPSPQRGDVVATKEDPYWAWEPGFLEMCRKNLATVEASRKKVATMSLAWSQARASRMKLQAALDADATSDLLGEEMRARLKSRIEHERESESSFYAPEVARYEKEGVDALQELADEIAKARGSFEKDHPHLVSWHRRAKDMVRMLPLELADGVADGPRLRALLLEAGSWDDTSPEIERRFRLLESKASLLRGDALGALFVLRDLHKEDPADVDVRRRLTEVEAALTKQACAKAHGGIDAARANFNRYLTERGFGTGEKDTSWVGQQVGNLRDYDSETAWVIWSTGIVGSISGILGRPQAEEEKLRAFEALVHNGYLGLQVITRLSIRGLTHAEIRHLSPEEILKEMPARTTPGKPWDLEDARIFRQQIDAALELDDVRRLVEDERGGLAEALAKSYWDPKEASSTWFEWVGDLTSPRNILTLWLPFLRVDVAGKTLSGTQAVYRVTGLEAAATWAATTGPGGKVADLLLRSATFRGDAFAWKAAQFVAYGGLQAGAGHLAQRFAGRYGQIVSEALLSLASDPDSLARWMTEEKVARDEFARMLKELEEGVARRIEELKEIERVRAEVVEVLKKLEADPTMTLEPALDARLKSYLGSDWAKSAPDFPMGGADDVARQLAVAVGEARRKVHSGIRKALEESKELLEAETSITIGNEKALKAARAATAATTPKAPEAVEAFLLPAIERQLSDFGARFPWSLPESSPVRGAFAKLFEGKADEAAGAFRTLAREAEAGLATADLPPHVLDGLAEMARQVASLPARTPPAGVDPDLVKFIPWTTLDAVVEAAQGARWTPRPVSSVATVEVAGEAFVVKRLTTAGQPDFELARDTLVRAAEGEVLHMGLCQAIGITAPAVAVQPRVAADGALELYVVSRKVLNATSVDTLKPAQLFQLQEEMSRHRGLAMLLGDYDRKLENYLLTAEGRLVAIDAAAADVRASVALEFGVSPGHPEFLEGAWGIGHWYRRWRAVSDRQGRFMPERALHGLLAELSITAGEARTTVDKVRGLLKDENRGFLKDLVELVHGRVTSDPALVEAYARFQSRFGSRADSYVRQKVLGEVVSSIDARLGRSEEALKTLTARNGRP